MEKLKFAVQVFTTISALPVLAMMELNHSPKKIAPEPQQVIKQQIIKSAESYYFKTTGGNTAAYPKKPFTRRYCK